MTESGISIEKMFEMYGRLSLERDLMREQIENLLRTDKKINETDNLVGNDKIKHAT